MSEHYTNLFFSALLHSILLFILLSGLFWLVISKIESHALYTEINHGIDESLKCITTDKLISESFDNNSTIENEANIINGIIKDNINNLKDLSDKYYSGEDYTFKHNNSQLIKFNIIIIILLIFVFIIAVFVRYMTCNQTLNFKEIIGENMLILLFVGGIEYYFFMNIARKFVPVKPSYMPSIIQKNINNM